jgi:hypothetical protein
MSFFDNARQSRFVKHEEKQENISRFAGFFLDRLSVQEPATLEQRTITLIARSPASPVARSLFASLGDCRALNVRFMLAFSKLDPTELLAGWMDVCQGKAEAAMGAELRFIPIPGLDDAHEQLVLGQALSWHGDSMRRDPETRDAFETFETFNTEAARRTSRAFKRIWRLGQPIAAVPVIGRAPTAELLPRDVLNQPAPGVLGGLPGTTASTRH